MSSLVISLKTDVQGTELSDLNTSTRDKNSVIRDACRQLKRVAAGIAAGEVQVSHSSTNPVAASASVEITHANLAANDTIVVCRQTLTAKASGANGTTEYNIGADAAADATALAACINANTTLSKYVTASAADDTVTVTCKLKGAWGNLLSITSSDNAYAITDFASGTGGFDSAPNTWANI